MSQSTDTAVATAPSLSPARTLDTAVSFFEETIWHNPDVCTNCFSRVKRRYQATEEKADGKQLDIDEDWRTPDGTLGETSEIVRSRGAVTVRNANNAVVGVESREPARGTTRNDARTTCNECGSVRAIKQTDTLSKTNALDIIPALVERLREQGHPVNADAVGTAVYKLKSDEKFEAYDKEVFATAVALGVEKA